jgi:hypothetical protein
MTLQDGLDKGQGASEAMRNMGKFGKMAATSAKQQRRGLSL